MVGLGGVDELRGGAGSVLIGPWLMVEPLTPAFLSAPC